MANATRIYEMEQRFAGVSNPAEMGTSGLIAWVIVGGGSSKAWNRYRTAKKVITGRGLDFAGFRRQLVKEATNVSAYYGEIFSAYQF